MINICQTLLILNWLIKKKLIVLNRLKFQTSVRQLNQYYFRYHGMYGMQSHATSSNLEYKLFILLFIIDACNYYIIQTTIGANNCLHFPHLHLQ